MATTVYEREICGGASEIVVTVTLSFKEFQANWIVNISFCDIYFRYIFDEVKGIGGLFSQTVTAVDCSHS